MKLTTYLSKVLLVTALFFTSFAEAQTSLTSNSNAYLSDNSRSWLDLERINGSKISMVETYNSVSKTHKIQKIMLMPGAQFTPEEDQALHIACPPSAQNCLIKLPATVRQS